MLKQVKLGYQLLRYGLKFKYTMIMMAVIMLIGLVVEFLSAGTNMIGAFYFMLIGMIAYQMNVSMDVATFVQVSPMKKALQTTVPVITSSILYLVMFTLIVIEKAVLIHLHPENVANIMVPFITMILTMFCAMLYTAICFKFYAVGFVLFMALVMANSFLCTFFADEISASPLCANGILPLALLGYVVLIIGIVLEYALSCAFYKKGLSEFAFKGFSGKIR